MCIRDRGIGVYLIMEFLDSGFDFFTIFFADRDAIDNFGNRSEGNSDVYKRQLLKVCMDEETESEVDLTFTTLMGDQVEPRRKFIEENAKFVKNLDI